MAGRRKWSDKQRKAFFARLKEEGRLKIQVDEEPHLTLNVLTDPAAANEARRRSGVYRDIKESRIRQLHDTDLKRGSAIIGSIELVRGPPKNYMRSHVGVETEFQGNRLGTALYILGLREVKRRGYKGIYSPPYARSKEASRVWSSLRSGKHQAGYDLLTSVRPHAKRRGKKLRKLRKKKAS